MNELDALRKRLRAFPVALDGDIIMLLDALDARAAALRGIANARRFDRDIFDNDSAFVDWAQSLARDVIGDDLAEKP